MYPKRAAKLPFNSLSDAEQEMVGSVVLSDGVNVASRFEVSVWEVFINVPGFRNCLLWNRVQAF